MPVPWIEDKSKLLRGDFEKYEEENKPKEEAAVQEQAVNQVNDHMNSQDCLFPKVE